MIILALVCLVLVAIPSFVMLRNLKHFQPPEHAPAAFQAPPVSVLIPARNEAENIRACIESVLANQAVPMEILVLDDHSDDETAEVVRAFGTESDQIELVLGGTLPTGVNGKQFACWQLAQRARYDRLLFLDADVRLQVDAIQRLSHWLDPDSGEDSRPEDSDRGATNSPLSLVSVFPHQQVGSLPEYAIVPLIHFVLLGFLPIQRMRQSRHASYAAGCGQVFFARRSDYLTSGGHGEILATRHDGIALPRLFRQKGFATDIADGTDIASVRMYHGLQQVCLGVLKNANEGLARTALILPATLFCAAPLGALVLGIIATFRGDALLGIIAWPTLILSLVPRFAAVRRFRQPWTAAIMHPVALLVFMLLHWLAFAMRIAGHSVRWKGRL